ncbi:ADP-heptose--lipooligosaccharide heptosyltransferase II [plant metagenome]|uniref:ADP-heptose--lipooligosaccharide heptosyltransferase II n=1 Tax=plant metagenome TaxID=1297885 RepID=A0A484P214_9ZZZZ
MRDLENLSSRRVLLVCQDNLGDLVFASAIAAALRDSGDSVSLDVLARPDTGAISRFMPGVERVHAVPSLVAINPLQHWARFRAFLNARKVLAAERYDVVFLVGKNWRLGWLVKLAGIPVRVGYAYPKLKKFLTHAAPLPSRQQPVVPALMTLLEALGETGRSAHYVLDSVKVAAARTQADSLPGQRPGTAGPWVGLHAFAGSPTRCVPLDVWRDFAQALSDAGMQVVWFGVARELQRLRDLDAPGLYGDALGDGSLDSTIGLLANCQAYAGHDSGVLHIASACGLRTLGVFAPGEPHRTFAQGPGGGDTLYRASPSEIDRDTLLHAFSACFPALMAGRQSLSVSATGAPGT